MQMQRAANRKTAKLKEVSSGVAKRRGEGGRPGEGGRLPGSCSDLKTGVSWAVVTASNRERSMTGGDGRWAEGGGREGMEMTAATALARSSALSSSHPTSLLGYCGGRGLHYTLFFE